MEIMSDVISAAGLKDDPDSDISPIEDGDFEETTLHSGGRPFCSDTHSAVSYVSAVSTLGMKFIPVERGNSTTKIEIIPPDDSGASDGTSNPTLQIYAMTDEPELLCTDYHPEPWDVVRRTNTHMDIE
jgi:hypothetical protein